MSYPKHLIPQERFRIIDFDLINTRTRYVIRHTESTDTKTKEGTLRGDLISTDDNYNHLRDFSTNLLGIYHPVDIQWLWTKGTPCLNPWNHGDEGLLPSNTDVALGTERGYFFLSVFDCHNARFLTISEQSGESEIVCKVLHTPLRANFWHCSLRWYCDGEGSEAWNKGRMRRMKTTIRNIILEKAILEEPLYQSVDPRHYMIPE